MATSDTDIKSLFAAGAHFGHRTSRWHPKMAPYIHSKRGGIHVIDLTKTVVQLAAAAKALETVVAGNKQALFVGTKRQARTVVAQVAQACDMPYVTERWFGGTLTNFATISKRITRLKQLEGQLASGELQAKYSKLEVQRFQEEITQLNQHFGGIKEMADLPGVLVVLDVHSEMTAVREANKLGIPVIGVVDTNTDPSLVDHVIPANDDAIKTLELIGNRLADAAKAGKARQRAKVPAADEKATT